VNRKKKDNGHDIFNMIDNLVKESNVQAFQKEFGLDFVPGKSSENNAKTQDHQLFDKSLNVEPKDKTITGSKQPPIVLKTSSISKSFQQEIQEVWKKMQGSSSENAGQTEEKLFDRVWNVRQKDKTVTGSKKLPSKTTDISDKDGKDTASNKETVAIPEKKSKEVQDLESPSKLTPKK